MTIKSTYRQMGPLAAALLLSQLSIANSLRVEIGKSRLPSSWESQADTSVRKMAARTAKLSSKIRESYSKAGVFRCQTFFPLRVVLTDGGQPLAPQFKGPGDIVPTFDSSGTRTFSTDYKAYLQSVFTAAKPAIDAVFGKPSAGGIVHIKNYDADIQDRYAVAGGYFVPNAPSGPEIRFAVYNNRVAAAVNYIHTLLLAYLGNNQYSFDAYDEGLVRAATILVCRTPGSIPGNPGSDQIEAVLSGLYDVGPYYDWFNKPGLGAPKFIAPNLLDTQLPIGGSTGGIFLLRYQLAGTAWAKVAIRYPGFIAEFNRRFYLNPSAYSTSASLENLGQQVLDTLGGAANTKIEGWSFQNWALRQFVLDTRLNPGLKLVPTPIPLLAQSGTSDFGIFNIVLNAFQTMATGDEILLAGTVYPIYWRPDFSRFFMTAQDDVIKLAGAYGSVAPNFPQDTFNKTPYRVIVDIPASGKNARITLPAGGVSTGIAPDPKSFFGTVTGLPAPGVTPYTLKVSWTGGSKTAIPVTNFAFSFDITDANFLKSGALTVQVFQGATEKIKREIVKSEGALALDLFPSSSEVSYAFIRPARLDMIGLPVEPYRPNPADILGLADSQTLFGRWDSTVGRYVLYPDEGNFNQGSGFWVRPPSSSARIVQGRSVPGVPVAVSLNPGWNQVTIPQTSGLSTADVLVTVSTEAVGTYDESVTDGTLGTTIFQFQPDSLDPDAGTMVPTTTFQPGRAYFVRANRTEGAVLLFVPQGGTRIPNGGGRKRTPPQYFTLWQTKVSLLDSTGKLSQITVGQAQGATRKLDPALDTDYPPLQSGFQLGVLNGTLMNRDFRPSGTMETYILSMKGLKVGAKYTLRFAPSSSAPNMVLADQTMQYPVTSNQEYSFVATAKQQTMNFEQRGKR